MSINASLEYAKPAIPFCYRLNVGRLTRVEGGELPIGLLENYDRAEEVMNALVGLFLEIGFIIVSSSLASVLLSRLLGWQKWTSRWYQHRHSGEIVAAACCDEVGCCRLNSVQLPSEEGTSDEILDNYQGESSLQGIIDTIQPSPITCTIPEYQISNAC